MRKLSMNELGRATPESFREQNKMQLVLVLDNLRSALNVGSAFRTADAYALEKIYLCGITATPPHREILKTALGATETVAWDYVKDATTAVLSLQKEGYKVWTIEQAEGSLALQDFDFQEDMKIAIVFGNEVSGVEDSTLVVCDGCLEIPQFGTKHSLNVAVCVGIVVWEIVRKMRFPAM